MTSANDMAGTLQDLGGSDDVTLVLSGGVELVGTVEDDPHHEPAERVADEPVPVPGRLTLHVYLDRDSWSDLPSRHVHVGVDERKPGQWYAPEATVNCPIYADEDESLIVDDEYEDLGEIVAVRTGEDQ